jgi:chromosome partitioning protein
MGLRVLLCDLDPQAGLTLAFGFDAVRDPWAEPVVDVMLPDIEQGAILLRRSGRRLSTVGSSEVEEILNTNPSGVDVVILDCPPAISSPTLAALHRSDMALVPLSPAANDIQGLTDLAMLIPRLPNPPSLRAVLVRVNQRRIITREVRNLLHIKHPESLLAVEIPDDARVPEAPSHAQDVTSYAPRCRAALAYLELAQLLSRDLGLTRRSDG